MITKAHGRRGMRWEAVAMAGDEVQKPLARSQTGENMETMNWEAKTDFEANSAEEFPLLLDSFLPSQGRETPIVERLQMTRLLEALFKNDQLAFPLKLNHQSDLTPEFRVNLSGKRVAVEATRIALRNVEQARTLQSTRGLGVLSTAPFYDEGLPVLEDDEIVRQGFTTPALFYPPTLADSKKTWWKRFEERLTKKTLQRSKTHFIHGDEDWLLLWDGLPLDFWSTDARVIELRNFLSDYWKNDWFTRVFIQHHRFDWLMVCSESDVSCIPRWSPD
jgi:hypothetical protein